MKKILLILVLGMFLINFVYATSIGTIEPLEDIQLYQTCNNCTYCNFTSIQNGDNIEILNDVETIQRNSYFYYDLDGVNITTLGKWTYCYECGNTLEKDTGCLTFQVTPSGQSGTANIIFFLFLILMIYGITLIGFFGRSIPITILGGMAMMFLGVYLINQGVIIYRDDLTLYFSYLTIGVGIIATFLALNSEFDVI